MEGNLQLHGFKELDALLKELPDEMAKKVLEQTVRAGGKIVLDAAKQKVPVRTGRLRNSLVIKKDSGAFRRFGSVKYLVGANLSARRGLTAPHAHLVEFGTVKMSARPFLEPAFQENKDAIITEWRGRLWVGIQKQSAILAGKHGTNRKR